MISSDIITMTQNIPPYRIASWLLDKINQVSADFHVTLSDDMEEVVYTILLVSLAMLLGWVARVTVLFVIKNVPRLRQSESLSALEAQKAFLKLSHVIPPIVFMALIPFAFAEDGSMLRLIMKLTWIYLIVILARVITAIFKYMWHRYDERDNVKNHPLRGLLQVSNSVVWLLAVIVTGSILLDRSPVALLTGLGAFAAILMLVFKDSILGLVAGVQLSQNDMLREGDWIVVPGTPANGIVIDVTLTVVKVRNWDNTLAMLPPYTLVSTSFQNWRGMKESGARRIARSLFIDTDSIKRLTAQEQNLLKGNVPLLSDYITKKQSQQAAGKVENTANSEGLANGTIDTNLGLMRAYMAIYVKQHPLMADDATTMIRQLEPTPQGIPLQVYCFTSTTVWEEYESIQSEVFEHFAVMLPVFGLYAFEYPSGQDVDKIAPART